MKKYVTIFILVICFVFIYFKYTGNGTNLHNHIDINDVESITINGLGIKNNARNANADEIKTIVNWYNSITDIRENKDGIGTTPDSSIHIQLKYGEKKGKISILQSGTDFEIQRYDEKGNKIIYWGKQPDIKQLLLEASRK